MLFRNQKIGGKTNGYKFRIQQNLVRRRINTAHTRFSSLRRLGIGNHRRNPASEGNQRTRSLLSGQRNLPERTDRRQILHSRFGSDGSSHYSNSYRRWNATGFKFNSSFTLTAGFGIGLAVFLGGLVIAFIFYVLAAMHLKQTFNTLAQKTGEHSFATASSLLWWGAILTIIGVGLILIFFAWIFAVVGFFTMKSPQQTIRRHHNTATMHHPPQPPQHRPLKQHVTAPTAAHK